MHPLLLQHQNEIARLCRDYQVQRLEVFGSAARGDDFDLDHSDIDFLIEFAADAQTPSLGAFFDIKEKLADVVGRPVDLVMTNAVRNPYVLAEINRNREAIYAR
jgi:uncharacterized protein